SLRVGDFQGGWPRYDAGWGCVIFHLRFSCSFSSGLDPNTVRLHSRPPSGTVTLPDDEPDSDVYYEYHSHKNQRSSPCHGMAVLVRGACVIVNLISEGCDGLIYVRAHVAVTERGEQQGRGFAGYSRNGEHRPSRHSPCGRAQHHAQAHSP